MLNFLDNVTMHFILSGSEMEGIFSCNSLVYIFMYSSEVYHSQKYIYIDFST